MEEKITEEIDTQNNIIQSKIYFIRGQKVMLDRDLAKLYGIKPIRLREQVKRNLQKFPENFIFQLTENEIDLMVSQNAIPSSQYLGGHLPYVFTEYGALPLANVIKSDRATQVSIQIIEIFIKMRELISTNHEILSKLKKLEEKDIERSEQINIQYNTTRTKRMEECSVFILDVKAKGSKLPVYNMEEYFRRDSREL